MPNAGDSSCETRASVVSICCHFLIRVASLTVVSEGLFFWTSLLGVSPRMAVVPGEFRRCQA